MTDRAMVTKAHGQVFRGRLGTDLVDGNVGVDEGFDEFILTPIATWFHMSDGSVEIVDHSRELVVR